MSYCVSPYILVAKCSTFGGTGQMKTKSLSKGTLEQNKTFARDRFLIFVLIHEIFEVKDTVNLSCYDLMFSVVEPVFPSVG